jgi:hypothetical protein
MRTHLRQALELWANGLTARPRLLAHPLSVALPSAGGDALHQPCVYLLIHPSHRASTDFNALRKQKIGLHLIDHRAAQARDEMAPLASAEIALCLALILGSITLGGGIYETLLVDPAWPRNLSLIQPKLGGLNRKVFWGLVHPLFELALLVSTWMNWNDLSIRVWLIVALVGHFAAVFG